MKLEKDAGILIPVRGDVVEGIAKPTLKAAQDMVEGYVEARRFTFGGVEAQALFNEDGLLKEMEPNLRASLLVGCMLVGPVVILTGKRRWT
jgi:hypothetical protein